MCQFLTRPRLSLTRSDRSHHPQFVHDKCLIPVSQQTQSAACGRAATQCLTPRLASSARRQGRRTMAVTTVAAACSRQAPRRESHVHGRPRRPPGGLGVSWSHGSGGQSAGQPARPASAGSVRLGLQRRRRGWGRAHAPSALRRACHGHRSRRRRRSSSSCDPRESFYVSLVMDS